MRLIIAERDDIRAYLFDEHILITERAEMSPIDEGCDVLHTLILIINRSETFHDFDRRIASHNSMKLDSIVERTSLLEDAQMTWVEQIEGAEYEYAHAKTSG